MMKIQGNSLYFVSGSQKSGIPIKLWKVNLDNGVKTWETIEVSGYLQSIQVCDPYVFLFIDKGSNVLCFDNKTGALLATIQFDADVDNATDKTVWLGSVVADGNTMVWGAGSGLYTFDITRINFSKPASEVQIIPPVLIYDVPQYTGIACTPVIEDHIVYFMRCAYMDELGENTIAAYNLETNTLLWERKSNKMTGLVIDGMLIDGEWLYIVDAWGSTCINKKTGGKNASSSTGERWVRNGDDELGPILSAHAYGYGSVIYDGKLYFTNSASWSTWSYLNWPKEKVKNIICMDCEDGTLVWGDMPPGKCGSLGARPVLANGKAYIAHYDGLRVYDAASGRLYGVDRNITSSGIYSRNLYYQEKNLVIVNSLNDDGITSRIVAIRAE